jgi:hypothetical protein
VDLVKQWIADPEPRRRAWAANLSIEVPVGVFDVPLIAGLERSEEEFERLSILDALIQRSVRIPEKLGLALFPRYPAQATILLYNNGCPAVETSKEILRNAIADEVWLVAAKCLATQAGGPVELLQTIKPKATIEVWDVLPSRLMGGKPGGPLGGIIRDTTEWPPFSQYELTTYASPQVSRGLSGGEHPVYYARISWEWKQTSNWLEHGDRSRYAFDILYPRALWWSYGPEPEARLHWVTPDQARIDLEVFARDRQMLYRDMLDYLTRSGRLTQTERAVCPQSIQLEVLDRRADRRLPLPNVASGQAK